jgi:hypothetical protein
VWNVLCERHYVEFMDLLLWHRERLYRIRGNKSGAVFSIHDDPDADDLSVCRRPLASKSDFIHLAKVVFLRAGRVTQSRGGQ